MLRGSLRRGRSYSVDDIVMSEKLAELLRNSNERGTEPLLTSTNPTTLTSSTSSSQILVPPPNITKTSDILPEVSSSLPTTSWVSDLAARQASHASRRSKSMDDLSGPPATPSLLPSSDHTTAQAHAGTSIAVSAAAPAAPPSEPVPTTAWSWTWGHLPVKFKAKSCADLESLSAPTPTLQRAESKSRSTSSLQAPVAEYREGDDVQSAGGKEGHLREQHDFYRQPTSTSTTKKIKSTVSFVDIDTDEIERQKLMKEKNGMVVRKLGDGFDVPAGGNKQDFGEEEGSTSATWYRMLSSCGDLLPQKETSVLDAIPTTPSELIVLLKRYEITEQDIANLLQNDPTMNENTSKFQLFKLVVVMDDFLLSWNAASAILIARTLFPKENSYQYKLSEEEVSRCILFSKLTNKETIIPYWVGKRLSTWSWSYHSNREDMPITHHEISHQEEILSPQTLNGEMYDEQNIYSELTIQSSASVETSPIMDIPNDIIDTNKHQLNHQDDHNVHSFVGTSVPFHSSLVQKVESASMKDSKINIAGDVSIVANSGAIADDDDPLETDCPLQDIPLDDISPHPARGNLYEQDSDTDSYHSFDEEGYNNSNNNNGTSINNSLSDEFSSGANAYHGTTPALQHTPRKAYKYRKSLVPPQQLLRDFNLRDGANEITFELEVIRDVFTCLYLQS